MKFSNRKYIDTEIGKVYLDMLYKSCNRAFYKQKDVCEYLNNKKRRLLTYEEVCKIKHLLLQIKELKNYKNSYDEMHTNSVPIIICDNGYSLIFLYYDSVAKDATNHEELSFPIIYKDL